MATELGTTVRSTDAFMERMFGELIGTVSITMASLGDRLGLFKSLARSGPATADDLAADARIDARYAREWLHAMVASGYLDYDAVTGRFALPEEYVPILADEGGPAFLGGMLQMVPSTLHIFPHLVTAFRTGDGVPQSAYPAETWEGMERETAPIFNNLLVQEWLPHTPDIVAILEQGGSLADIGCGSGRAILNLAAAFPNATFTGYDVFPPQVERARVNAREAGVSDRVQFEVADVSQGLGRQFDVITTFDVVHDAVDPLGMMTAIRQALRPGGLYMIQEFNSGESLEDNLNPLGAFFYGVSVLYCMTVSLSGHGAALGTAGMPESVIRDYAARAGFASVRTLPIEDMFHRLYELRA